MQINLNAHQMKLFGRNLKVYRIQAGLTQQDVAILFEWSTAQQISNWETGQKSPSITLLAKLIGFYKLTSRQKKQLEKQILKTIQISISNAFNNT